jgi:AraC-like DNA-binding protein
MLPRRLALRFVPASPRNSVHIGVFTALVRYLERKGHSAETFGRLAGTATEAPADPDARISVAVMKQAWKAAVAMTGDPALGLAVGTDYSGNSHGILGHLIAHSETLGDALGVLCRYFILLSDWQQMELKESGSQAWVRVGTEDPDPAIWPVVVERTFASIIAVARSEVQGDFSVESVEFDYAEPAHSGAYRRFFGVPCRFRAKSTRMIFPRGHLRLPMRHRHSALRSVLSREAEAAHRSLVDQTNATTAGVWNVLPQLLDRGVISAQAAAEALHLSARTLHRRLSSEGSSYLALLDKARYERSMRLMEAPDVSLEEIALACGFLDNSGFYRGFKRWTGMAPRAYRALGKNNRTH